MRVVPVWSAKMLAALVAVSVVLSAFPVAFFVAKAAPTPIFSTGFEEVAPLSMWSTADLEWQPSNVGSAFHSGSYGVRITGTSTVATPAVLQKNISTLGYENITVSYWYKMVDFEAGDTVTVDWFDGVNWSTLQTVAGATGTADDMASFVQSSFMLPAQAAENTNFALRFRSVVASNNDDFFLDDIEISGEAVEVDPEYDDTATTITVTGNTASAENEPGWMFGRDLTNDTPFAFDTVDANIGDGALHVLPIGATPAQKFIAEYFLMDALADLESFSVDFKIGPAGDSSDADQVYLNVYANFGVSADDKYYDCRYDVVATTGSTGSYTTLTFDPAMAYPVTTRTGGSASPFTCPAVPADMDNLSASSTIRAIAFSLGDTSANDVGLDGFFDKAVVVTTDAVAMERTTTTYDFEPMSDDTAMVEMCKIDVDTERPLSDWTLLLTGPEVTSFAVPANSMTGIDTPVGLNAGASYVAVVTGTWLNDRDPDNYVDAEYSTEDNWVTHMDGFDGYGTNILELQINEDFGDWGAYNGLDHTYVYSWTPDATGPVNFRIFDGNGDQVEPSWYGDNSGELEVTIYEGYASVTGEDGCFTLDDIPTGTYEASEIMQAGWMNVSGEDEYTVSEDTTITIANRLIPDSGALYVEKVVVGGDAVSSDFSVQYRAIGDEEWSEPVAFDETGEIRLDVPLGTYEIREIDANEYTAEYAEGCDDMVVTGVGESPICYITNTYDAQLVCTPEVNLLANGGFEDPVITNPALWDTFTSGLGWLVNWVSPSADTPNLELQAGVFGWAPAEGLQHAELDSSASTRISQLIPTIAGATYTLDWQFSGRPGTRQVDNKLSVYVDGTEVVSQQAGAFTATNTDWRSRTYQFTGTGDDVEVAFADLGTSNGLGTLLDAVSLTCSPAAEYGAYCGDEMVNQDWEQCEIGDEGCTEYCRLDNQCQDLTLVKINVEGTESPSFDGNIYLGAMDIMVPNNVWFPFAVAGDASVHTVAMGTYGLAVERDQINGLLKLAVNGDNDRGYDLVKGTVAIVGGEFGALERTVAPGFRLESGDEEKDRPGDTWIKNTPTTMEFDWRTYGARDGATVAVVTEDVAPYSCPDDGGPSEPSCELSGNLLTNGGFETPTITNEDGWDVFDSVINGLSWMVRWINPSEDAPEVAKLELQNGRAASEGTQYAELDSNYTRPGEAVIAGDARVQIDQTIATVPGQKYFLTYDLSAVPGHGGVNNNKVNVIVDGSVVDTETASLAGGATSTSWSSRSFEFIATGTSTSLGLGDAGRSDTFGTLIDNVSLTTCLPDDGGEGEEDGYEIFGYVWHDEDEDDAIDGGESSLSGWTVRAQNASNTTEVYTAVTDSNGRYTLFVPAGTWIISEEVEGGWALLSDADGDGTYTVTVPTPAEPEEFTLLGWFIPTAMAAVLDQVGPYNFGNERTASRGGSSSGTRVRPTGTVLGIATSTPTGQVLGDATSTLPIGAPNTGAGGTAPMIGFIVIPGILSDRIAIRRVAK